MFPQWFYKNGLISNDGYIAYCVEDIKSGYFPPLFDEKGNNIEQNEEKKRGRPKKDVE